MVQCYLWPLTWLNKVFAVLSSQAVQPPANLVPDMEAWAWVCGGGSGFVERTICHSTLVIGHRNWNSTARKFSFTPVDCRLWPSLWISPSCLAKFWPRYQFLTMLVQLLYESRQVLAKFINLKKCWPSLWISPCFGQVYQILKMLAKLAKFMNLKFWPSFGQVYESRQVLAKFRPSLWISPSFGQVYESRQVLAKFRPSLWISPSFGQVYESRQVLAKAKFMNLAKFWPSLWISPSFGQVYESRQVLAKFQIFLPK